MLDSAYKKIIKRIRGQLADDRKLAERVLSWITFSKRPLTVDEMQHTFAVELNEAKVDPENIPDVDVLMSVCAGLVIVDENSAIIRLVHYTTQEYLEQPSHAWTLNTQLDMATTCLNYLSLNTFKKGSCSTHVEYWRRLRDNPFLVYSAKHWGDHARSIQGNVARLACVVLLHGGLSSCAAQVHHLHSIPENRWLRSITDYTSTALHRVTEFGLCEIAEKLLVTVGEEIWDVIRAKNSDGEAPLYTAAETGHVEMVELLLKRNAGVNAEGGNCGRALIVASYEGHELIVKVLLENGANSNVKGEWHDYTAIEVASLKGHELVMRLLLNAGTNDNQRIRRDQALVLASVGGYGQIVKLLLKKNANGGTEDIPYGEVLAGALEKGHEQIALLLLDQCVDIDILGGRYLCELILESAAQQVYERMMILLLGMDTKNYLHKIFLRVLWTASRSGHKRIVKLLLEVSAKQTWKLLSIGISRALHVATLGGYKEVVEMLLNWCADKNVNNEYIGINAALWKASREGHKQIVKLSLDNGANPNSVQGNFRNALQEALYRGHKDVATLLRDHGAELPGPYWESDYRITTGKFITIGRREGWNRLRTSRLRGQLDFQP